MVHLWVNAWLERIGIRIIHIYLHVCVHRAPHVYRRGCSKAFLIQGNLPKYAGARK